MSRFTVAREATLEGVGLHLGEQCRLTFKPAPAGQGIVLQRVDITDAAPIRASAA